MKLNFNPTSTPPLPNLHFSRFGVAIRLIVKVGKGALMAKTDIKSAYRIIPIHRSRSSVWATLGALYFQHSRRLVCMGATEQLPR